MAIFDHESILWAKCGCQLGFDGVSPHRIFTLQLPDFVGFNSPKTICLRRENQPPLVDGRTPRPSSDGSRRISFCASPPVVRGSRWDPACNPEQPLRAQCDALDHSRWRKENASTIIDDIRSVWDERPRIAGGIQCQRRVIPENNFPALLAAVRRNRNPKRSSRVDGRMRILISPDCAVVFSPFPKA